MEVMVIKGGMTVNTILLLLNERFIMRVDCLFIFVNVFFHYCAIVPLCFVIFCVFPGIIQPLYMCIFIYLNAFLSVDFYLNKLFDVMLGFSFTAHSSLK
jgi:hypothetical protein